MDADMTTNRSISVREAAQRLSLDLDRVYKLLWSRRLEGCKIDGRWLIRPSALAQYQATRRVYSRRGKS